MIVSPIFTRFQYPIKKSVKLINICCPAFDDMVVYMPDTIYILELKTRGTAEEVLKQIVDKDYAVPYMNDNRKVVKVGLKFDVTI